MLLDGVQHHGQLLLFSFRLNLLKVHESNKNLRNLQIPASTYVSRTSSSRFRFFFMTQTFGPTDPPPDAPPLRSCPGSRPDLGDRSDVTGVGIKAAFIRRRRNFSGPEPRAPPRPLPQLQLARTQPVQVRVRLQTHLCLLGLPGFKNSVSGEERRESAAVSRLTDCFLSEHEAAPAPPAPLLRPPLRGQTAPPPRRRVTGGGGAAVPPLPAPPRGGQRGGGAEERRAPPEAQRGAAALHRPDLPPAAEHDPDGQDAAPARARSAQPQTAGRGGEVRLRPQDPPRHPKLLQTFAGSFCSCARVSKSFLRTRCHFTHHDNRRGKASLVLIKHKNDGNRANGDGRPHPQLPPPPWTGSFTIKDPRVNIQTCPISCVNVAEEVLRMFRSSITEEPEPSDSVQLRFTAES